MVDEDNERVHLMLNRMVFVGETFKINLKYTGMMTDDQDGLYYTLYEEDDMYK